MTLDFSKGPVVRGSSKPHYNYCNLEFHTKFTQDELYLAEQAATEGAGNKNLSCVQVGQFPAASGLYRKSRKRSHPVRSCSDSLKCFRPTRIFFYLWVHLFPSTRSCFFNASGGSLSLQFTIYAALSFITPGESARQLQYARSTRTSFSLSPCLSPCAKPHAFLAADPQSSA